MASEADYNIQETGEQLSNEQPEADTQEQTPQVEELDDWATAWPGHALGDGLPAAMRWGRRS